MLGLSAKTSKSVIPFLLALSTSGSRNKKSDETEPCALALYIYRLASNFCF